MTRLALWLVLAGAVGNTIDRVRFGAVVDFLDFHAVRLSLAGLQRRRQRHRHRRRPDPSRQPRAVARPRPSSGEKNDDRRSAETARAGLALRHGGPAAAPVRHGPGKSRHRQALARRVPGGAPRAAGLAARLQPAARPRPARRRRRRRILPARPSRSLRGQAARRPAPRPTRARRAGACGAEPRSRPSPASGSCWWPRMRELVSLDANRFLFILNFQRKAMQAQPNVLDPVAEARRLQSRLGRGQRDHRADGQPAHRPVSWSMDDGGFTPGGGAGWFGAEPAARRCRHRGFPSRDVRRSTTACRWWWSSNHRAPVVAHWVWYKVGTADSPPGKSGPAALPRASDVQGHRARSRRASSPRSSPARAATTTP